MLFEPFVVRLDVSSEEGQHVCFFADVRDVSFPSEVVRDGDTEVFEITG